MSSPLRVSLGIPKALHRLSPPNHHPFSISCERKTSHHRKQVSKCTSRILGLALQVGGVLATVAEPAFAVTGVNEGEDLVWILIQSGISAFFYFLVVPPIIMNWLRKRWYKRNLLEMYVQFMFVFLFFPGVLLWAPFLNFRKFPRDPAMKYPWSVPQNPSEIKGGFLKYPWAKPEDYEV
ncbi:NAD(P)H-quinone oxidoreductase subunit L, chloroplastic [Salvia miltiorrhiza]|uniref:NAD(P)H-quinone oxidoreductase subunit L, chloroplastic n=1 Tax=Salvia miltiorrhiza TaxID=226208 RepID=UPI0025AC6B18|nr:NAD(P)H-quinone oxidoreductase subunit L, chloroplastic [Salvia miltiorrhiza]